MPGVISQAAAAAAWLALAQPWSVLMGYVQLCVCCHSMSRLRSFNCWCSSAGFFETWLSCQQLELLTSWFAANCSISSRASCSSGGWLLLPMQHLAKGRLLL